MGRRPSIAHYNNLRRGGSASIRELDMTAIKGEFARRLQDAMIHKGWRFKATCRDLPASIFQNQHRVRSAAIAELGGTSSRSTSAA